MALIAARFPVRGYINVTCDDDMALPYALDFAQLGAAFVAVTVAIGRWERAVSWTWQKAGPACPDCGLWHSLDDFPDGTCNGAWGRCNACGETRETEWHELRGARMCVPCYDKAELKGEV